jgi:hypothetical protein
MRVSSSLLRADGTGIANRVDRAARRVAGWLPED